MVPSCHVLPRRGSLPCGEVPTIIVSGTGHRPCKLGGRSERVENHCIAIAYKWLNDHEIAEVITGMAEGWDTYLALAAILLGIPLHAAVPFAHHGRSWDNASRKRHDHILTQCHKVTTVSDGPYRDWMFQARNRFMVDNSNHVLACWDGSPGGTGNCVRYADKVRRPVTNLYRKYLDIND